MCEEKRRREKERWKVSRGWCSFIAGGLALARGVGAR